MMIKSLYTAVGHSHTLNTGIHEHIYAIAHVHKTHHASAQYVQCTEKQTALAHVHIPKSIHGQCSMDCRLRDRNAG